MAWGFFLNRWDSEFGGGAYEEGFLGGGVRKKTLKAFTPFSCNECKNVEGSEKETPISFYKQNFGLERWI